jgi:hypothetical protein
MDGRNKIPNLKHQAPNKSQVPNSNDPNEVNAGSHCFGHWAIGAWNLFGIWSLEFGI